MPILAQDAGIFETLTTAAAQAPALVVLAAIVYVFLDHIKKSNDSQAAREQAFHANLAARDAHLTTLSENCHEVHRSITASNNEFNKQLTKDTHEALSECKVVIKDNTIALTGIRNELMKKGNMGS